MLEFLGFALDCNGGGLFQLDDWRLPIPVPLGWRALEVLSVLVERRGTIVSRKEIIDAVWPGITVAENNLTIQISSLRRVLDAGRGEVSCIQTVPGRGYRFVGSVTRVDDVAGQGIPVSGSEAVVPPPPRLSMVILPFVSLDDDPDEDRLGNAITDDLTTELARLPGARVIARRTADVLSGRPDDIRRLDGDLSVRYVIEGSVRRLSNVLRVNAKLVSTETNTHLWAGRFDEVAEDRTLGQEAIIGRLRSILSLQLLKAENARSMRERPDRPDAYDLLLRAWPAWGNTSGLDSLAEAAAFFEQSLQLDPLLVPAMCGLAYVLVDRYKVPGSPVWADESLLERAAVLLAKAATIEPDNERLLYSQGFLLLAEARFAEACAVLQRVAELLPNEYPAHRGLGLSLIANGQAERALPVLERAIRLDPVSPTNRFMHLWAGFASLLLQRDEAAPALLQQALVGGAVASPAWQHRCYLYMASAQALLGKLQEARDALAEANRLWPFATVRGLPPTVCGPRGRPPASFRNQIEHIKEGLRLAGLRDHAVEDADFGVAPNSELHTDLFGYTPTSVPGAATISTGAVAALQKEGTAILIDVALESWGWSLQGAVGLQGMGCGNAFSETRQHRFESKIRGLTRGDLSVPIVTFCTNSERFTGYNLALRLVALGYTNIYWYRGGREAWEVAGLPETPIDVQDW
ncbi:MAG: FlgO family outer membrane protein [Acetobacteraceae bacterium]